MAFEPGNPLSSEEVSKAVEETVEQNHVALFMKGTKLRPECGYSMKAVELLTKHVDDLATVNVLFAMDAYREALAPLSGRETIPQAYVDGEFVGGSDILEQLDNRGELEATLQQ